ncbi:MAG TPA: glycosyltransferase family 87 protein, partial [Thermoanaerobaculia bacterium]
MNDERPRARPLIAHRSPLALIAILALILLLPALLQGEVFTLRDHSDYFQPLRWFTAQELQAGRLPLWNPYNASGEPWLANPQTAVFYPPAWLFVILPFATAYVLFLYAHLALLGCGAYLLFRRTASEGAALVGAAALMFSGPVLSLLDVSNNLATLAWIPLALWCAAEGAWRRGGVVLAMAFLGGEPFFAGIAALMFIIVSRRMRVVLGAGAIAFGVSAIQLFPFLEFVRRSDRAAGLDPSLILMHSMSLGDWLRIAVPPKLGASAIDPNLTQHFIPIVYVGIAVCVLALLGIRRRTAPWLVLLVSAFLISLGPQLLTQLPVTFFRYPARLVPLAAIALAALAVAGWERVRPDRRWADLIVVLVVLLDLAPRAWPLLQSAPFRADAVPYPRAVGQETKILRAGEIDARQRTAWIAGYLNLYDRRFDAFTASPLTDDAYARMYRALQEKPSTQALARAGVGWILTSARLGLEPVARAGNVV